MRLNSFWRIALSILAGIGASTTLSLATPERAWADDSGPHLMKDRRYAAHVRQRLHLFEALCVDGDGKLRPSIADGIGNVIDCTGEALALAEIKGQIEAQVAVEAHDAQVETACVMPDPEIAQLGIPMNSESGSLLDKVSCSEKEAGEENRSCVADLGCNVLRSVAQSPVLYLPSKLVETLVPDLKTAAGGCLATDHSNCVTEFVAGALKDLWSNVTLAWDAVKWAGGKLADGWRALWGVEDQSSDKMLAASQQSPSFVARFLAHPIDTLREMGHSLYEIAADGIKDSFMCEKWSGEPHVSTCLTPKPEAWKCASCDQKMNAVCGVIGVAGGEVLTAYLTGGALSLGKSALKGLGESAGKLAGKGVLETAVKSSAKGATELGVAGSVEAAAKTSEVGATLSEKSTEAAPGLSARLGKALPKATEAAKTFGREAAELGKASGVLARAAGTALSDVARELAGSQALKSALISLEKIPGAKLARGAAKLSRKAATFVAKPLTAYVGLLDDAFRLGVKHGEAITGRFSSAGMEAGSVAARSDSAISAAESPQKGVTIAREAGPGLAADSANAGVEGAQTAKIRASAATATSLNEEGRAVLLDKPGWNEGPLRLMDRDLPPPGGTPVLVETTAPEAERRFTFGGESESSNATPPIAKAERSRMEVDSGRAGENLATAEGFRAYLNRLVTNKLGVDVEALELAKDPRVTAFPPALQKEARLLGYPPADSAAIKELRVKIRRAFHPQKRPPGLSTEQAVKAYGLLENAANSLIQSVKARGAGEVPMLLLENGRKVAPTRYRLLPATKVLHESSKPTAPSDDEESEYGASP